MQRLAVGCHELLLCLSSLLASAVQQLILSTEAGSVVTCHYYEIAVRAGMTAISEVQRDCSK